MRWVLINLTVFNSIAVLHVSFENETQSVPFLERTLVIRQMF